MPFTGTCATISGTQFTTTLDSCAGALDMGYQIVDDVGLSNGGKASDITLSTLCGALQGGQQMTYSPSANYDAAARLSAEGVCPGDIELLVPG